MRDAARPRGRQQRPAADRTRRSTSTMDRDQISAARADVEPGRDGAVQRLRHPPGVADLRAEQSVPGDHAGGARSSRTIRRRSACCTCARSTGRLIPLDTVATRRTPSVGPVVGQPHRPAAVGDDLVQPRTGRRARRRRRLRSSSWRRRRCRRRSRRSFQGTAQAFQDSLQGLGLILIMAIVVIYIVLGMLYESFTHPLTILSGLPSAGFGALLTLLIFKTELSLYAFVGVIMLVGLVKKNGIMMVDFAVEAQRERTADAARGDSRGLPGPLPADHDDDDGGAGRHAADRARARRRRRVAAAARARGRRRPARVAAADALHHAGLLRLHRGRPPAARAATPKAPSRPSGHGAA